MPAARGSVATTAGPKTDTVIGSETAQFAPDRQRTPIDVRPHRRVPGRR